MYNMSEICEHWCLFYKHKTNDLKVVAAYQSFKFFYILFCDNHPHNNADMLIDRHLYLKDCIMIPRVKGTHDFLDLTLFNFITQTVKFHFEQYHFTQIRTPILEHLDLFKRSLGEVTDVVTKEMFIIESQDEQKICLRPEVTAPVMRAFIEHGITNIPWKVYSWGSMFRHERPQKGRFREFNQISLEMIGAASISYDIELIAMLDRLFSEVFKLPDYALVINFLGSIEDRKKYKIMLQNFLMSDAASGICATCMVRREKNPLRVLDCKNPECQNIYKKAPAIIDSLSSESLQEWQAVQDGLSMLSVSYVHNSMLVRGLDYYSKTVFEFVSGSLGSQNTFCGGGRYDQLATELGARHDQPSIGAAIGIERLLLLLEPIKDKLALSLPPKLISIMPFSSDYHMLALLIADVLRAQGKRVDVQLDNASIKSMMRTANRMNAEYALLVGQEEQANKTVSVKHMTTGNQEQIAQADLVEYFKRK